MRRTRTFAGILTGICIALAVIGLGISPASAATTGTPHTINTTVFHAPSGSHFTINATGQQEHLRSAITRLGSTGVDVTEPQADLATGNVKDAMSWLMAYHKANPGSRTGNAPAVNTTKMTERLGTLATRLGSQGVDVTQLQADIAAGKLTAAGQWLADYRKDHPIQKTNATQMPGGNVTARAERLQSILTTLGTKGVDVSQPLADISSGNLSAAMQWLVTYHKDHPDQKIFGNTTRENQSTDENVKAGFAFRHRSNGSGNTTRQS